MTNSSRRASAVGTGTFTNGAGREYLADPAELDNGPVRTREAGIEDPADMARTAALQAAKETHHRGERASSAGRGPRGRPHAADALSENRRQPLADHEHTWLRIRR